MDGFTGIRPIAPSAHAVQCRASNRASGDGRLDRPMRRVALDLGAVAVVDGHEERQPASPAATPRSASGSASFEDRAGGDRRAAGPALDPVAAPAPAGPRTRPVEPRRSHCRTENRTPAGCRNFSENS